MTDGRLTSDPELDRLVRELDQLREREEVRKLDPADDLDLPRIVDVLSDQQTQTRRQLSISRHAVVAQQLVPRRDRPGRVPALELLTATYAVRNHIRNQHPHRRHNEVTLGERHGMVSLANLVRAGTVAEGAARIRCSRPEEIDSLLREGAGEGG